MLESTFYLFLYCSWPAQCLAQSGYLTNTCHRLGFRLWAGILSWLSCIHPTASIILPTTFRDQMAKSRPTARLWGSNICCCLFLYILIFIYVFIWLYRVLVVACGIFFFFWRFIYFGLCWVFIDMQAFSSCSEQGLLFVAIRGLLIAASLVMEHRLWLHGLQ